jgi:hypothetical protein
MCAGEIREILLFSILFCCCAERCKIYVILSILRVSLVVTLRHEQRGGIRVAAAAAAFGAAASDQRHSLPPRLLVGERQRMVRPRGIQISHQENF